MKALISIDTAEQFVWGEACDGWHLLRSDDLSIIEEHMPPGSRDRRHFHSRSRQFFYVLAGELTIEIVGQYHLLKAGYAIEISPGEPHQAFNKSDKEVRFLLISQPPSQGDRQPT